MENLDKNIEFSRKLIPEETENLPALMGGGEEEKLLGSSPYKKLHALTISQRNATNAMFQGIAKGKLPNYFH